MAIKKVYELAVDLKRTSVRVNVPVLVQGDSAEFRIRLLDNGAELSTVQLTGITKVSMQSGYDAQTVIQTVGELQGSVAVFRLQKGELFRSGTVQAMVQLEDTEDRISTLRFQYQVIPDLAGNYIPGEQDVTIFQRYMNDAQVKIDEINAAAEVMAATDVGQLTTKLAETDEMVNNRFTDAKEQNKAYQTYSTKSLKPVISFIDDDGRNHAYGHLFPIFQQKNKPLGLAIVSGNVDKQYYVTSEQLDIMYNSGLVEILGHAYDYTYPNMVVVPTEEELIFQLDGGKKWLEDRGYKVDGFVYPQGRNDERVRTYVKQFFDFAFTTARAPFVENNYLDSVALPRIAFGSYTDTNPTINGNSEKNTLAYYKACVDYAKANNGWLVFMIHVGDYVDDEATHQIMRDLIDYIDSQNIDILKPTDGFKIHGNKVYAGDFSSDKYTLIDRKGELHSSAINAAPKYLGVNAKTPLQPPSSYANYSTTTTDIRASFASSNGFPENAAGNLSTVKYHDDYPTHTKQEYKLASNDTVYSRSVDASGNWKAWRLQTASTVNAESNTVGTDPISAYDTGVTISSVGSSNPSRSSFPSSQMGILTTYKYFGSGAGSWQDYQVRNSFNCYRRYWDSSASNWSAWKQYTLV